MCLWVAARRKAFDVKRKAHYNEYYAVKMLRQRMASGGDDEDEDDEEGAEKSTHGQGDTQEPNTETVDTVDAVDVVDAVDEEVDVDEQPEDTHMEQTPIGTQAHTENTGEAAAGLASDEGAPRNADADAEMVRVHTTDFGDI